MGFQPPHVSSSPVILMAFKLLSCHMSLSMLWRSIILWKIHLTCYYSHDGGLTGCLLTSFGVLLLFCTLCIALVSIFSCSGNLPSMNSAVGSSFPISSFSDLLGRGWLVVYENCFPEHLVRLHFPAFLWLTSGIFMTDPKYVLCPAFSPIPPLPLPSSRGSIQTTMTTLKAKVLKYSRATK